MSKGTAKNQITNTFSATREHHSIEAAEDYCELILELIEKTNEARICNIAKELGVSHVTAIRTIQRLKTAGYVNTSPRKPVTLTAKGKKLALHSKERHELVVNFLIHIGTPKHIAEIDAEGAEHHFSDETLRAIKKFISSN